MRHTSFRPADAVWLEVLVPLGVDTATMDGLLDSTKSAPRSHRFPGQGADLDLHELLEPRRILQAAVLAQHPQRRIPDLQQDSDMVCSYAIARMLMQELAHAGLVTVRS